MLLAQSKLQRDASARVIAHVEREHAAVEEVILEFELLTELELLKVLAAHYKTFYVSSEKLARIDMPPSLRDMLPRRFAEQAAVCPVIFDSQTHTLSIVTATPDNADLMREVQVASGIRNINAFVARPAAISAAILKYYAGDLRSFSRFERTGDPFKGTMTFERQRLTASIAEPSDEASVIVPRERMVTEEELTNPGKALSPAPTQEASRAPNTHLQRAGESAPLMRIPHGDQTLELFNVLVGLLEMQRNELRGHSSHVARLCRKTALFLGLSDAMVHALEFAAYAHDLGKAGQFHLTALNVAEYDGHRTAAKPLVGTPLKVLSPIDLPSEALDAVSHMYERFDGKGFPNGLAGRDIPIGARILAVADTYSDLTQSPRNPYRKALLPSEACDVIFRFRSAVFDPSIVDAFSNAILGENARSRLLTTRSTILLVDGDNEEARVLELRLVEQGFVVRSARTVEQARKVLASGSVSVVIGELLVGDEDGLNLLEEARKQPWGAQVPWIVHARAADKASVQRAFELGATDFVAKPAEADMLIAKMKALLDLRSASKIPAAVSGALSEMGLADLIQVMWHSKKTGCLSVHTNSGEGELHLLDGYIVNARWGKSQGENAFYSMLKLKDGEFSLDPKFKPTQRLIHQSTEALLLEGMRRLDEGLVR